ncbi:DUF5703 family protein [Nesterenkonia lacusekhoensis]|uniref:Uncharacterized protein n=1 Tax=Nesterenkonia lacusekhoensis TaxID=150832 RepID=A0ABS4T1E3_9MICC|nr:DUF5703 family protein [Nesterenkonia lacusekhoensis]MBP2318262.1 hypothetical protein [Nesterenkonia lacusekhoensis]
MAQQLPPLPHAVSDRWTTGGRAGPDWEYVVVTCQPHESLNEVRRQLAEHAEYGKWELRRSRIYGGGMRKYWLRRRIMKVRKTL